VVLSFVAISEKIKRNPDDNIFIAVGLPLKLRANHTFNKILFCVCLFGGFRLRSVFFWWLYGGDRCSALPFGCSWVSIADRESFSVGFVLALL